MSDAVLFLLVSNSVVLQKVPGHSTVVEIPGRIVKIKDESVADEALMDRIPIPDPIADRLIELPGPD